MVDGPFELVYHAKVNNFGYRRAIGGGVLDFKSRALIRRSARDGQLSVTQFKERVSTGFRQTQGL